MLKIITIVSLLASPEQFTVFVSMATFDNEIACQASIPYSKAVIGAMFVAVPGGVSINSVCKTRDAINEQLAIMAAKYPDAVRQPVP